MASGSKFADVESSSESENEEPTAINVNGEKHVAQVRIHFETSVASEIAYKVLRVDREPDRSSATRMLSLEGNYLNADFSCSSTKFLQKSVQNFFDMCNLTRQTMESVPC
jgi:hydroxymethylpyrimidine pyrophosphatase-like HAD family hydrolase